MSSTAVTCLPHQSSMPFTPEAQQSLLLTVVNLCIYAIHKFKIIKLKIFSYLLLNLETTE